MLAFPPRGGGPSERHLVPEPSTVGTPHPQNIASQPSHVRTGLTRVVRRPIGVAKTTTRPELVSSLCPKR
jgi:hypothetical protein